MNEVEKQYADAIIETLQAILSADKALIDKGQLQLNVLESRSEYSFLLVKILLDQTINFGIRQLAGVLFKQFVEIHWSQNSEKFKQPEIESDYKTKIRQILPHGLADQTSKIRVTVAYAIATIAHWDWPELWPELFPTLIQALSGNDLNAIHGSIKTLSEFIDEVTDIQMPHVAPALMPQIYNIFVNPQHYQIRLRSRSIEIFNSLVNVVAEMSEYDKTATKKYLSPYLANFLNAMIKSLSLPDDNQTMDYGLKKDIIKTLTTLVKSYPKKLNDYMNDILTQVWNCLVQSSNFYVSSIVNCSKENRDEQIDPDGEDLSFENLVYQLFEFILCLKDKSRYKLVIKKVIEELCYYAILYMQITEDQMEVWINSPDQFVEEEDEETYSYSIRICGQELLESLTSDFKKESAIAICKAISRHIEYAHTLKQSNNPNWWKLHESCLLAIGIINKVIQDLSSANMLDFDLNAFINQVVISSLCESNYPFLVGRALYTASKFSKLLHIETLQKLVEATAGALQVNQNPIIRLSAMRAIYCFCEELTDETKQPILVAYLQQIGEGLIQMITENISNPIGALSLETLGIALSIDEKFVAAIHHQVGSLAIAIFVKQANDPLINSIVIDIFKILISNPYSNQNIEGRLLPVLNGIFTREHGNLSGLLTSSLDLLTTFVRSSTNVPLSDRLIDMFGVVANLCLNHDDTALLQSGGECLRAFISKSSEQVINWKDFKTSTSSLTYIIMVINHMLDPKTSENSCSFIGKFINTVIRHTAHALGDNLDLILKAVLSKMQSSKILLVQQSLIIVFAHLIHAQMDNVLTFLSNLPGPTGKPVLEFLMTEWVGKQNSFVGPYECKISILALAKLLEHAISKDDIRFQNVFVKGDRIINPVEGIKTRSKSKNEQELYTQVPLLVKIYKLLINELNNQIEERKDENEDEYDEDCEDYEDEGDECDDINGNGNDYALDVGDENATNIEVDQENENYEKYLNRYDIYDDIFDKDEIFDEDDPEALTDPLMKIDLLEYLTQYLKTFAQQPCYNFFKQHHNECEKQVLKEIKIENA